MTEKRYWRQGDGFSMQSHDARMCFLLKQKMIPPSLLFITKYSHSSVLYLHESVECCIVRWTKLVSFQPQQFPDLAHCIVILMAQEGE